VQRAQPFAGAWGVPTSTLFSGWVGGASESFDTSPSIYENGEVIEKTKEKKQ